MGILDSTPVGPAQFNFQLQQAGLAAIPQPDNGLRQMVNVARYTENLSFAQLVVLGNVTLAATPASINATINGRLVTLTGVVPASFNANIQHRYSAAMLTPFAAGTKYLVSYYVYCPQDVYFYMRPLATTGSEGHGTRGVRGGMVKRVWTLFEATSQTLIDPGVAAEVALGLGSGVQPQFYQAGQPTAFATIYIGGFQIEAVAPTTKNGIAIMGDSTVAGSSGKIDTCLDFTNPENCQWSTHLAVALNCDCYNRGVGGQTLTQMLARWATDMSPLAANSKYCIIQGGINDIQQGHTVAQMQSDLQGMITLALADGYTLSGLDGTLRLIAVAPTGYFTGTALEQQRQTYNVWLKAMYGAAVLDYSTEIGNPWTVGDSLNPTYFSNETPNVHPNGAGREVEANFIAANGNFTLLPQPTAYQRQPF